ncbi:MAG: hypothetical protein U0Y10_24170 [Spirosomataceae bacterium]
MKKSYAILAFFLLVVVASFPYLRQKFSHHNISIGVSEDTDSFRLTAEFPENQGQKIHNLLKNDFQLKQTLNLDDTEYNYLSANKSMNFHLVSKKDYLEIVLDKRQNSKVSVIKLKRLSEEIKKALAS